LSTATIVRNRIKSLEKQGIIIQYRVTVNLEKLGLEFFKAIIHIENKDIDKEKSFISYLNQLTNIQYFIRNLWDLEIELVVKDYLEYNQIMNKIKEQFPSIITGIETVIMKSDVWIPSFFI
jgi:DNA-binding Lrp family transcriptional regulator